MAPHHIFLDIFSRYKSKLLLLKSKTCSLSSSLEVYQLFLFYLHFNEYLNDSVHPDKKIEDTIDSLYIMNHLLIHLTGCLPVDNFENNMIIHYSPDYDWHQQTKHNYINFS